MPPTKPIGTAVPFVVPPLAKKLRLLTAGADLSVTVAPQGAFPVWAASTPYGVEQRVSNGAKVYKCVTAGTSAGSGGPTGTDKVNPVTDGTAKWVYLYADAQDPTAFAATSTSGVPLAANVALDVPIIPGVAQNVIAAWNASVGSDESIRVWAEI